MQFIAEPLNQADKDKSFRVTINYPNGDTRRYVANGSFRMTYSPCTKGDEFYIYTDKYDTEEEFVIVMELCDDNLFSILSKRKEGFKKEKITPEG